MCSLVEAGFFEIKSQGGLAGWGSMVITCSNITLVHVTSELESGIAFLNIQSDCDPLTAGQGGPKGFCTGEPQNHDVTDISSKNNHKKLQILVSPGCSPNLGLPKISHILAHFLFTSKSVYELDLGGHLFFSLFFTID